MLSGRVDATLGAYWNYEAIQLRQMGKPANVIHVENAGVPTYDELVLVARENEIANRTNILRRFVQALGRGYESVRARSRRRGRRARAREPVAEPQAPARERARDAAVLLPAASSNLPWGWQDPEAVDRLRRVDARAPSDLNPAAIVAASTNQLLAGQGP